jgi:hypothetical protein
MYSEEPNKIQIRAKRTLEEGSPSVWSQTVGVRVEVLGSDLGVGPERSDIDWSRSEGRKVGNSDLGVRERGPVFWSRAGGPELILGPTVLGWRSGDWDSDLWVRVRGPLAST